MMCVASGGKAALSLGPNWDEGGQNPQKIEGNYLEGLGAKNKTTTTTTTTKHLKHQRFHDPEKGRGKQSPEWADLCYWS